MFFQDLMIRVLLTLIALMPSMDLCGPVCLGNVAVAMVSMSTITFVQDLLVSILYSVIMV